MYSSKQHFLLFDIVKCHEFIWNEKSLGGIQISKCFFILQRGHPLEEKALQLNIVA